jgi:hypothetical protein
MQALVHASAGPCKRSAADGVEYEVPKAPKELYEQSIIAN